MRLKYIKLAGFKSFVDPTTVYFPHKMSGIVGPNGCGKSNVIDAVRWVMGESSAKHLRGESMADVIFNGSSSRKPIGQASIELVFDNSLGIIKGEFAAYNEVSVKRKVTRDGLSQYYLNNNKCRKKDVTDLFLGTGLGPRSYAIIEQGMISRLIESKPDELRVFIEEAAGISRYKERRRETENRIRRTRENLDRLSDIREELDRQLQHLQRQAKAAERYKELKVEERRQKAMLSAFRWNVLDTEARGFSDQLAEQDATLENLLHERVQLDNTLNQLRNDRQQAGDDVDKAQADYYGSGAEIAKLEQQIKGVQEREQQLKTELDQLSVTLQDLAKERDAEQLQRRELKEELAEVEPELEQWLFKAETSADSLAQAEENMQVWQAKWDEHSSRRNELQKSAEIEQARIQQTEKQIEQLIRRKQALESEKLTTIQGNDDQMFAEPTSRLAELELSLEEKTEKLVVARESEKQLRAQIESLQGVLNDANTQRQRLAGEDATLQAFQQHDDNAVDEKLRQWLADQGLADLPVVSDLVSVDSIWETAFEALLGTRLKAKVINKSGQASQQSEANSWCQLSAPLPEGLTLVAGNDAEQELQLPFGSVAQISAAMQQWLGRLQTADSIAEAESRLASDPALICLLPDGSIVARHWLAGPPRQSSAMGILARNRRMAELSDLLAKEDEQCALLQNQKQSFIEQHASLESQQEQLRREITEVNKRLLQAKAEVSAKEAREAQLARRCASIEDELIHINQLMEDETLNLRESREVWQQALLELEEILDHKELLLNERDAARSTLDHLRIQARQDREHAHQLQVRRSALATRLESVGQALEKTDLSWQRSQQREQWINQQMASFTEPQDELQLRLEEWLALHLQQQKHLEDARDRLNEIDNSLQSDEVRRLQNEQNIQERRARIEALRMQQQEAELRKNALKDQLLENNFDLQQLLPMLNEEQSEADMQAMIEALAGKINRLGAINLAAIDEYQEQSERKVYLDRQNEDLLQALETLEAAIRKIDKETRAKFRDTYDQVNEGLQNLFPKVFGGGSAALALTGDDLLETGVAIMARPPGKKNSTIHLLSGGEKALTAIALIFSIFQLNPAPFCMLDEVDAPLDDANVSRYTRLVKEMAEQVQFIYITHNKIAMEMADHLMGVTMHEPGVSRLVSVDVEEAAAMAAM